MSKAFDKKNKDSQEVKFNENILAQVKRFTLTESMIFIYFERKRNLEE
jgi:hypothetical protein